MSWANVIKKPAPAVFARPQIEQLNVDLSRLVTIDFETYYDDDYTLRKLSTSEYVRDSRFEVLMMGIKVGNKPTRIVEGPKVRAELAKINWATHTLLCHHTQFDGFILSHHYGVHPAFLYDTLSMARGLHSSEIGAGLDEVSVFYGGAGKIQGGVEDMKGLRFAQLFKDKPRYRRASTYCGNDVDETIRIFKEMLPTVPADEMRIIDVTCRLFTDPVLRVDLPRVQKELTREVKEKEDLLISVTGKGEIAKQIVVASATKQPKRYTGWTPREIVLEEARKTIASNESFADLLRAEGIDPPRKISPAYFKHRDDSKKWAYAFAKTDLEFTALQEHPKKRVRDLVETRLSVKSTIGETRAGRFLKAGEAGAHLPVYLRYYGAHTGRWSGGNKMNLQNLERGGELRKSIMAAAGHVLVVADSGQIEARVNAWLWGQDDLLHNFRLADAGLDRDAYCKFGDVIYGRKIVKGKDDLERFIAKTATLGLGFQMGAPKFQATLARGIGGPPVFMELDQCQMIVNTYRRRNAKIVAGWRICERIIGDMAAGRTGSYKCLSWEKETLWLPNGMALKYPGLRSRVEGEWVEWSYKRKDQDAKIYGGLLCENIVQALARIIVAGQLLAVSAKHRVVMTTHDEIVAMVKKALGQKVYDFMLKTMRTPPPWCSDIPLSAEGGFDVVYSK